MTKVILRKDKRQKLLGLKVTPSKINIAFSRRGKSQTDQLDTETLSKRTHRNMSTVSRLRTTIYFFVTFLELRAKI